MGSATLARGCASTVAIFAGGAGLTTFVAALYWLLSLSSLDLSDSRHWQHVIALAMSGTILMAYAVVHAIFWWRPMSYHATAARATFTLAGGVLLTRSVVYTPPTQGCGMAWLANLAPLVMITGFVVVEFAAWVGWWDASNLATEPVTTVDRGA